MTFAKLNAHITTKSVETWSCANEFGSSREDKGFKVSQTTKHLIIIFQSQKRYLHYCYT